MNSIIGEMSIELHKQENKVYEMMRKVYAKQ